ncbi:glycosyltransferase family 4 protein [Saccharospirillum sp.]|uniref:glycosyltransferase family 4 protein n=1 Tax=Saccharospirillum sp. TaxID=2033801 RepID=UPI00349FF78B
MLKQFAEFADVDLVTLLPRSKVRAYYSDFHTGHEEIRDALSSYVNKYIAIPHGLNVRKLNKYLLGVKSLFNKTPYDVLALNSVGFKRAVHRAISSQNYDAIYVDTVGLCGLLESVDCPVIVNHHNIESQMLERRAENSSGLLQKYFRWQAVKTRKWEEYWCNRVSMNFVCSELDSRRLQGYIHRRIEVIPNGVDIEYFKRSSEYSTSDVAGCIFAGGLEWYPNAKAVDFIVNSLEPVFDEKIAGGPIVICGKGWHKGLSDLSKKSKKVRAAGFVDDIRIPMEKAALYICPISDGGGTKLKVLDALAMGIPLIAHPIACEGIDVVEGRHVVYASTTDDYIKEIEFLMSNPSKRRSMSKAGIELIEGMYSYSNIGRKLKNVIGVLTENRSRS